MAATGPIRGCPVACEFAYCKLVARVRDDSDLQLLARLRAQCARSGSPSENTDADHRIVVIGVLTPSRAKVRETLWLLGPLLVGRGGQV